MKTFYKLLLFSLVIFTLPALAQNGTRSIDYNAKTIGRAGVSIGYFDSPELMMTNPAGISFLSSSMLDANLALFVPSLHFQNTLNNKDGKTNYYPLPDVAYVNKINSNWSWGIGFFTQGGMGADYNLYNSLYHNQSGNMIAQAYHSKFAVMEGGPSVAYKFTPSFSVGISAHVVYSMLEFQMPYSLSPSVMNGVVNPQTGMTFGQMFSAPAAMGGFGYNEVTASADMSDLSALSFTGKIGLAYKVNDQLSFGLSYTLPTSLTFKNGKATMDMTYQMNDAFGKAVQGYMAQNPNSSAQDAQLAVIQEFSQMGIDLSKGASDTYNLETKLKLPQSLGFGVSYSPVQPLRLGLDVEWLNWSNAFNQMSISLTNGQNPNIARMLGSNSLNVDFPLDWKNAVLIKVGGQYDISTTFTVRAGYAYGENPVPSSTLFSIFPAIAVNHIMVGASYKIYGPVTVNAAYEIGLKKTCCSSNSSQIASEYDSSMSDLSANVYHLGLSWGL
jgi:long-chain fatty acid transport protein